MVDLNSNPKLFNVDKFLECMSNNKSVFMIYFILIDKNSGTVKTALCPIYHNKIIETLRIQHHWAGRSTRGVSQIDGHIIVDLTESSANKKLISDNSMEFINNILNI